MFFLLISSGALAAAPLPAVETNARLTPGTITIEQARDGAAAGPTEPAFVDAVQAAILRAGYTPLPVPGHSRYVVIVTVTHTAHGVVTSGTKGSGPAAGVGNWGAGISIRLPKKDDQLHGLIVTELKVTVLLRSDEQTLWSGSAVTAQVDGTRAGAADTVAGKLADALFARFPNRLDAPLSVP